MHWPKKLQLEQLELPDKRLVVCYVVWLESMNYGMGLWTSARCVVWSFVVVRMAIEAKYRNLDSHRYISHM